MRILVIISAALLSLATSLSPVSAATLEKLSLNNMIQKSTTIVRARVQSCAGEFRGPVIYTRCKVAVSEQWKGVSGQVVDLMIPGGVARGLSQTFSGSPKLTEGSEYVLFLWTGKSGMTQVIGLSQGVFDVPVVVKGQAVATRDATSETMVNASGVRVQDEVISMGLVQLKAKVLASVTGGNTQ
jgi:hypothetical protein